MYTSGRNVLVVSAKPVMVPVGLVVGVALTAVIMFDVLIETMTLLGIVFRLSVAAALSLLFGLSICFDMVFFVILAGLRIVGRIGDVPKVSFNRLG